MLQNTKKRRKVITKRQRDIRTFEPYTTKMEVGMVNQSVILRKRQREPESKVNPALTPQGVFLDAYKQVSQKIDGDSWDYLQSVTESILSRLAQGQVNGDSWEFKSIDNMATYIKGSIKRRQIKTEQSHAVTLKDSLDDVYADIPDYKRIPHVDLYTDIREAKKKGTKKDLFTEEEKGLITAYLEEGQTIRHIAKQTRQARMTVQRQLESISKRIARLPIRGLYGFIESDGVSCSIRCEDPESRPLVTRIGLLRRYRRTKNEVWLTKYRANSERIERQHDCRVYYHSRDSSACFEPGGQLKIEKAQGKRVSVIARHKHNQVIIDLYYMTINGLVLQAVTM